MVRKLLYILSGLLVNAPLWAQSISFQASGPSVVSVGEQFYITYTVNSEARNFKGPAIADFDVLTGPNQSQSSSVQVINGSVKQSYNLSLSYVLRATKTGKFIIPSASIDVKNKTYTSNELTIEVVQGNQTQTQTQPQSGSTQTNTGTQPANETVNSDGKELFIRILVDKTKVYQGEGIYASLKIYSKVNISSIGDLELPGLQGFFKQDLETPQIEHLERENINGEIYYTGVIQKFLLFPIRSGDLLIDKVTLSAVIQKRVTRSDDFFDDFFPSYKNVQVNLASDPVRISVMPWPANQPNSFDGAVGNFTLNSSLTKTQCQTNEAITLKITINGKGNLKLINALKVNLPTSLEQYEPKINTDITAGQSGSIDFEYLFIPRYAGDYTIPPVEFSYFDPVAGQYKTLKTQAYTLTVTKGPDDNTNTVSSGFSKEEIKYIGSDIRHIKTKTGKIAAIDSFIITSPGYWFAILLIVSLFAASLFIYKKQIKASADIAGVKKRRARRISQKRLKLAFRHLHDKNTNQFYIEIEKAVWGYLSNKLSIDLAELSKENAFESLQKRNINESTLSDLSYIIDQCEYARYAPGNEPGKVEELYNRTIDLLDTLQEELD